MFPSHDRRGRRKDVEEIQQMLDDRVPMREVAQANFGLYLRSHRAYERYQQLMLEPRDPETSAPIVIWLYGSTGAGKTRYPYRHHRASDIYPKPPGQWFDGYTQQPVVLLDDFDPSHINFRNLLHLLDRYPHQVPVKGGFVQFNSKFIYITSDRHPRELYPNPREYSQLLRRMESVIDMSTGTDPLEPDDFDSDYESPEVINDDDQQDM